MYKYYLQQLGNNSYFFTVNNFTYDIVEWMAVWTVIVIKWHHSNTTQIVCSGIKTAVSVMFWREWQP